MLDHLAGPHKIEGAIVEWQWALQGSAHEADAGVGCAGAPQRRLSDIHPSGLGARLREQAGEASVATSIVQCAIATAHVIVIGPSNPVISIGPILAVHGMREALTQASAPVVAVSPLVRDTVVKGPTAAFMESRGLPVNNDGIATYYDGLIDGLVADQRTDGLPVLETDVLMATADARRRVADETLNFALALG